MSQYELFRTFGGGRAGPSAYEVYVEVATAAGQPVLSKAEWIAREGNTFDDTALRQRLSDLEAKELPDGQQGEVVGYDITGKPVAVPLPQPTPAPTWDTLVGRPPAFPPEEHQHPISDVIGLQNALDAKAESAAIITTEQFQDLVAAMFQSGTHSNASVTYNDSTGTLSIAASGGGVSMDQEAVEDFVGGLVLEGTGISVVYDDAGNVLRISLAGESYTTAEKVKLAGIAINATANQTDEVLLDRANHTGVQAIGTVNGLQDALDAKAPATHSHLIADVEGLQAALDGKVQIAPPTMAISGIPGGLRIENPGTFPDHIITATAGGGLRLEFV